MEEGPIPRLRGEIGWESRWVSEDGFRERDGCLSRDFWMEGWVGGVPAIREGSG